MVPIVLNKEYENFTELLETTMVSSPEANKEPMLKAPALGFLVCLLLIYCWKG
jgi:hypothetical protein